MLVLAGRQTGSSLMMLKRLCLLKPLTQATDAEVLALVETDWPLRLYLMPEALTLAGYRLAGAQ